MNRIDSRRWSVTLVLLLVAACGDSPAPAPGEVDGKQVARVEVSPAVAYVVVGKTIELTAVALSSDGTALAAGSPTWTSSDPSLASIEAPGKVHGLAPGTITITATIAGVSGTAALTVGDKGPARIDVTPNPARVEVGGTLQLVARVLDADGVELPGVPRGWSSANPGVATVDETGLLRGIAVGQVSITVKEDEVESEVAVTVAEKAREGLRFRVVRGGGDHTCAVTFDDALHCWGAGESGQLGNGKRADSSVPVPVGQGARYVDVTSGASHSCARDADGHAFCFGANGSGQLGDSTLQSRDVPTPVAGNRIFKALSAGADHTCGVMTEGALFCWGHNDQGQLGNGTNVDASSPQFVPGIWFAVDAGAQVTCALSTGAKVFCWGRNDTGQLGVAGSAPSSSPQEVPTGAGMLAVSVGDGHACGIDVAGNGICWGNNADGQLATGGKGGTLPPTIVAMPAGKHLQNIELGDEFAVGMGDGMAYIWGSNHILQLGFESMAWADSPVALPGNKYTSITAGARHACGIRDDGLAFCWGSNDRGKLGTGTDEIAAVPGLVKGQLGPLP